MSKQEFTEEGLRGNPASEPKTIQEAAHDVPGAPPHYPEHVRITQAESEGKELTEAERAEAQPTTVTGLSPEEEAEAFADKRPDAEREPARRETVKPSAGVDVKKK
jgi:hypothetical protein